MWEVVFSTVLILINAGVLIWAIAKSRKRNRDLKARSRSQKLAARRQARGGKVGRPFIENVAREPNGRISRAITPPPPPEPADKLALEVRALKMGVSVEEARDQRLGSYFGRLAIFGGQHGGISEAQYAAGRIFLEVYNDWRKAVYSPGAFWEQERLTGEELGLSVEEVTSRAKERYREAMRAVQEAQNQAPNDNLYAALQYIIIEDKEWPHLVGALRLVLNGLVRHFFKDGELK